MPGGPKLLHLTFNIKEGPEVKIAELVFDGNKAVSDKKLAKQMKDNKARGFLSFITGGGQYPGNEVRGRRAARDRLLRESRLRQGAGRLASDRNGSRDSKDGKTREVRLRIPVDEGEKYKVGKVEIAGNTSIRTEFLRGRCSRSRKATSTAASASRRATRRPRKPTAPAASWSSR